MFRKKIIAVGIIAGMTASFVPPSAINVNAESAELFNDTFETGYDSWAARGDEAKIEIVSSASHSGNKSLFVSGRTISWNGASSAKIKELRAGKTYDLSAWVMYEESTSQQEQFNLQMLYKDSSGKECYKYIANTQASAGEWKQIKGTVTIPEDATGVTIYIETNNSLIDFYIDDVTGYGEPVSDDDSEEGFFDDFTGSTMLWSGRGNAECSVSEGTGIDGGDCLFTQGRTSLWNGPSCNKTLVMNAGGYYKMSGWVKYEGDEWTDTQTFTMNIQMQQDGKEQYVEIGRVTATKGKWACIEANYMVPADACNFVVYFQTAWKNDASVTEQDLMDFYIDDVKAEVLPVPQAQTDIPSLKEIYQPYFILGGSCSKADLDVQAARDIITKHYDSITFGNNLKPDYILDQSASQKYAQESGDDTNPQINIDAARPQLDFVSENNIKVRGHVLVWHSQTPDWFFKEGFSDDGEWVSKEKMIQRLENYIKNVMTTLAQEYPDVDFYAWDVVNEAYSEQGTMRVAGSNNTVTGQSAWVKVFGDDSFIDYAFEFARKYAPEGCKLFYNDYNEYTPAKRDAIIEKVSQLSEKGIIDGIGMQSHIGMSYPSLDLYEEAFRKYNELGLEIQVTELDIDQKSGSKESMLELAKRYQDVFKLYKKLVDDGVNITAVVTWGITDNNSWIGGYPNLFDADYQAKDAFYAIVDTDSTVKQIQTANAVKYDGTDADLEKALEVQKANVVEGKGEFKLAWNDNKLIVKVTPNNMAATSVKVKLSDGTTVSSLIKNTNDTITVKLPDDIDTDSMEFDIIFDDVSWNNGTDDSEDFGKINFTDMPLYAEAVEGTAVIDGKIDDVWNDALSITTSTYTLGSGAVANVRTLWDEDYLYVLAEVKDPNLSKANANAYEQDSVEIFFDENNNKTSAYQSDDIQFRVNYDNEKTITDGFSSDIFKSATSITSDGYIVELAIPSSLGGFTANQVIGFDAQVNDDDGSGSRTSISNWSDITGLGYTNTSGYGVLKLTGSGSSSSGSENDIKPTLLGDANNDGIIDVRDVTTLKQNVVKLITLDAQQSANADVISDGTIDVKDLGQLIKYIIKVIDKF
jgi:endo-1,4-beta-xylanase